MNNTMTIEATRSLSNNKQEVVLGILLHPFWFCLGFVVVVKLFPPQE
jgi:hypothetical protein